MGCGTHTHTHRGDELILTSAMTSLADYDVTSSRCDLDSGFSLSHFYYCFFFYNFIQHSCTYFVLFVVDLLLSS